MDKIKFLGRTGANSREIELDKNASELKFVDLSHMQLTHVDLKPVKDCPNLRTVNLSVNLLASVDLTPLAYCKNLKHLHLLSNRLTSIDLSPLGDCPQLESLFLGANLIASIDLSPLSRCVNLETLDLSHMKLLTIDLSPLAPCTKLFLLDIAYNPFKERIDLTPLADKKQLIGLHAPLQMIEFHGSGERRQQLRTLIKGSDAEFDGGGLYILGVKGDLKEVIRGFLKKNQSKFDTFWEEWEESKGDLEEFSMDLVVDTLVKGAEKIPDDPLDVTFVKGKIKSMKEELALAKSVTIYSNVEPDDIEKFKREHVRWIAGLRAKGFVLYYVRIDQSEYPTYLIEPLFIEAMDTATGTSEVYFDVCDV